MIRWNWSNSWKVVFILLGMAFVFGAFGFGFSKILGLLGCLGLVVMCVLRWDDVRRTLRIIWVALD
jgi:small-conductance mechanosensitive channel